MIVTGLMWELGESFIDDVLSHYLEATEDLKTRASWFWFSRALSMMEWSRGDAEGDTWQRAYSLFPEGVADPNRARRLS